MRKASGASTVSVTSHVASLPDSNKMAASRMTTRAWVSASSHEENARPTAGWTAVSQASCRGRKDHPANACDPSCATSPWRCGPNGEVACCGVRLVQPFAANRHPRGGTWPQTSGCQAFSGGARHATTTGRGRVRRTLTDLGHGAKVRFFTRCPRSAQNEAHLFLRMAHLLAPSCRRRFRESSARC